MCEHTHFIYQISSAIEAHSNPLDIHINLLPLTLMSLIVLHHIVLLLYYTETCEYFYVLFTLSLKFHNYCP